MTTSLKEGMSVTRRITVTEDRTIDFLTDAGADNSTNRVYATPSMIHDIETVCRDFLLDYIDDGLDSLGTHVDISHTAPTLLGMWAEITATAAKVDGRAISFAISACDQTGDKIADGRHDRFIIDVEKTRKRLAAKAAQAAGP